MEQGRGEPVRDDSGSPGDGAGLPALEYLAALFGYRLRPGATFATLATLLSAAMRGLVIMARSMPELAEERLPANPFGADGDWSLDAVGLTSIAQAFLEPEPVGEWDDSRIAAVRATLESLSLPEPAP